MWWWEVNDQYKVSVPYGNKYFIFTNINSKLRKQKWGAKQKSNISPPLPLIPLPPQNTEFLRIIRSTVHSDHIFICMWTICDRVVQCHLKTILKVNKESSTFIFCFHSTWVWYTMSWCTLHKAWAHVDVTKP